MVVAVRDLDVARACGVRGTGQRTRERSVLQEPHHEHVLARLEVDTDLEREPRALVQPFVARHWP